MKNAKFRIISALLVLVLAVSMNPFLPQAHAEEYHVGDIITFGTYEQNNNRKDGPEDIEWIVLEQKEDRLLLISRFCIDCKPYHSSLEPVTWETSSLRKWLNHDFIDKAFSEDEQSRILTVKNKNPDHTLAETSSGRDTDDQVFILTMEEAKELFSSYSSRQAKPTAYAIAQGAYVNPDNQMTWWWLRTTSWLTDHVTFATSGGDVSVEGREVNRQDAGIRPVMWISTDSAQKSTTTAETSSKKTEVNGAEFFSPIQDGTFTITPTQFLERFISAAEDLYPEFHWEKNDTEMAGITFYLDNSETQDGSIYIFKGTNLPISNDEWDSRSVWCFSLGLMNQVDPEQTSVHPDGVIPSELLKIFISAFYPTVSDDSVIFINSARVVSCLNAIETWENLDLSKVTTVQEYLDEFYDDFSGYAELDDVFCEFNHMVLPVKNPYIREQFLVYAANWKVWKKDS